MIRATRHFLTAAVLVLSGAAAWGYVFIGPKWAANPVMHLQLGDSGTLIDGASSWNVSAEDALATWNQAMRDLQFTVVRDSTVPVRSGDGVNNVCFADTVYGMAFGNAVAITTQWTRDSGRRRTEGDTLFNRRLSWNSYRGPLKRSSTGTTLYDLRRVALHEFGHTLGLDHPDEDGQSVTAIMNSRVSNVDELQNDDIRGAQALYGARAGSGGTSGSTAARARFTRPTLANAPTRGTRYEFRGRADVTRATAVFLTNDRLGNTRTFRAAGVSSWRRVLAIRPGRNVIRLYVRTPSGAFLKVGQRVIVRRTN